MKRILISTILILLSAGTAFCDTVAPAPSDTLTAAVTAPAPKVDTGDTSWVLISAALVMLMTPGLAFFYGGLAGKRNILGIMIQSFVSMCITTVLWHM